MIYEGHIRQEKRIKPLLREVPIKHESRLVGNKLKKKIHD